MVVEFLTGVFRFATFSFVLTLPFIGELAQAELHSGGSGYSRGYADGPTYGYGGSSARNACDPTSGATNIANPSFGTPLVPGQANPAAAPQTVASAARPAPTPQPTQAPTPNATDSKPAASNAPDDKKTGGDPDPAPGKEEDAAGGDLVAAGKKAFDTKCMGCHADNGIDPLEDKAKSIKSINGEPGVKKMPEGSDLSDSDKSAILAYLKSLK